MSKKDSISNLEDHLGYWLRLVSNHVSHAFQLKVETHGVTVAEWVVMRGLFAGDELNPSQLAEELGMTRGAISKLVDRLVAKKLVAVKKERHDRRYQSVRLTAAGEKLVPKLAALADANDAQYFGHFTSKERAQFIRTLKDIVDRYQLSVKPID